MKREEQERLIDALLDGGISEADLVRLEAEMLVDVDAREVYYDRLALDTVLTQEIENAEVPTNVVQFPGRQRGWMTAAIGLAALLVVSVMFLSDSNEVEPIASGYGVIVDEADARWADGQDFSRGDLLPGGELKLLSGLVKVELFSGVTVVLEGDAEFEVVSSMEMAMKRGRLQADVPEPAQGFRVTTAAGNVVDLGTEFALEVTEDSSEVTVLNGEVEWHGQSSPKRLLTDGQGVREQLGGSAADLSGVLPNDLESALSARRSESRSRWEQHSVALADDPRLISYFPTMVASDGSRRITDASGEKVNGVTVLAKPVADRWGEPESALDFSPVGSRVRVNVPGEYQSLTMMCWIRIDRLDRWYNSLFLTDGHELNEPHWQIMDDGRLFFSVKAHDKKKDKHIAYSPPIWSEGNAGEWMQVAVIYDGGAATTTHLVNGEVVSVDQIPKKLQIDKVRIGAASIGNWSEPMRNEEHFAVRNLNGAMDEFAMFGAALSPDEIRSFYEIGKP